MSNIYKTIRISAETHDLLAREGDLRDSFDTVIKKLISKQKSGLGNPDLKNS